ncbi:MAG: prepilin-type N-terminal cleavage/methylation domain-containing protein [Chthoniobacteraceae bacterium]
MRARLRQLRRGFLLIEVMVAVAIFAIAVLALGEVVETVMSAQILKDEDEVVRRFLDGKVAEIEAGAVPVNDTATTEDIKDWLPGAKIKTKRTQLKRKNEKDQELFGLYVVDVEVSWMANGSRQARSLSFYTYPEQR